MKGVVRVHAAFRVERLQKQIRYRAGTASHQGVKVGSARVRQVPHLPATAD
jgi:hypothetical protein